MEAGIQITLDGQRVLVTQRRLETLAQASASQFKRAWLAANGYAVDEKTPLDYVNGVWQTLSLTPEHAIAIAKSKRISQIENNYKTSLLS